eukprot:TRINITY_DN1205_c0_g1_i1.p1 TRINITY_DN1205_c0_g1~~TRINITY_DN1205_c0_g1_i1.p1  ORF type:complete len:266 (-),score=101.67 TRINITY_DN1205_c0_g1_i1:1022-1819(-)
MDSKIQIFSLDTCPYCKKAKALLTEKNVGWTEVSITANPHRRQQMFLLTNGKTSVPQIFFNGEYIGGADDLNELEEKKVLDDKLELLKNQEQKENFPFPDETPKSDSFLTLFPEDLQSLWDNRLEELNQQLSGDLEAISSLLIMLSTPDEMVVISTFGEGKVIYTKGAGGEKGEEGSDDKLYCQVAVERGETLFIEDLSQFPDLSNNEDFVKFGYGYYLGAVWVHKQMKGTIVAMEKNPNILKREHIPIIEQYRDILENDLNDFL